MTAALDTRTENEMVSHPLSRVYGQYVVTRDDFPVFVTSNVSILFELLGTLSYGESSHIKVLLVSSEEFATDDITAFVWEAMRDDCAGQAWEAGAEAFREQIGYPNLGFIYFGFDEFEDEVHRERSKREAEANAHQRLIEAGRKRFASQVSIEAYPFLQAAE